MTSRVRSVSDCICISDCIWLFRYTDFSLFIYKLSSILLQRTKKYFPPVCWFTSSDCVWCTAARFSVSRKFPHCLLLTPFLPPFVHSPPTLRNFAENPPFPLRTIHLLARATIKTGIFCSPEVLHSFCSIMCCVWLPCNFSVVESMVFPPRNEIYYSREFEHEAYVFMGDGGR